MRNKLLFEEKLERYTSDVKHIGYLIHQQEGEEAYKQVAVCLEKLEDLKTLLSTEEQDPRH